MIYWIGDTDDRTNTSTMLKYSSDEIIETVEDSGLDSPISNYQIWKPNFMNLSRNGCKIDLKSEGFPEDFETFTLNSDLESYESPKETHFDVGTKSEITQQYWVCPLDNTKSICGDYCKNLSPCDHLEILLNLRKNMDKNSCKYVINKKWWGEWWDYVNVSSHNPFPHNGLSRGDQDNFGEEGLMLTSRSQVSIRN